MASPCRDASICVYGDGKCLRRGKKRVLAPGEMESLPLHRSEVADLKELSICIEEGTDNE